MQDWSGQDATSIASEICGFITILSGTMILHITRKQEESDMQRTLKFYVGEDSMKGLEDEHLILIHGSDFREQ